MNRRRSELAAPDEPPLELLRLSNVRCFETADVPLDPRVTIIIGENGAGKTTIAEALASLTAGDDEGLSEFPLRRGAERGSIALFEAGTKVPAASWSIGKRAERHRLPSSRYLFAYGRYRRVQYPEPRQPAGGPEILGPEWEAARYESLEKDLSSAVMGRRTTTLAQPDNHILRDLGRYLGDLNRLRSSDPRMDLAWTRLDESVRELREGLGGIDVIERDRRVPVVLRRGLPLELRELSDGYQAILVIVFDLLLRYVYLPPFIDDPLAREATVVIDEIDLHLHPRWQRRVVRQLTRLFPGTQFVMTTHSPAVVQGAIDFGHRVLMLREKSGAVSVVPLAKKAMLDLKGAQLGSVVVDARLFGVSSRYSSKYEATERKVRLLRKKLEAGTATEEDRQVLLDRLDRLEQLVAAEEERCADGPLLSEIAKVQIASLKTLASLNKETKDGATRSKRPRRTRKLADQN